MRRLVLAWYKARCERLGKPESESGIAMLLALAWGIVFMMLAMSIVASVNGLTRASGTSDNYYSAYAAAQAGIDDYLARLQLNPVYWQNIDPTNKAYTQFVPVPGATSDEQYTYSTDTRQTAPTGQILLTVTGKAGKSQRRLQAILRRKATIDYVLFSDYQTQDPYMPGAYGDLTTAKTLCENRYWWSPGPVGPRTTSTNGNTRNNNYCEWASVYNTEKFVGDSHTNDVWFLGGNLPSSVSTGVMSSSCPTTVCPAGHSWIDTTNMNSPAMPQNGTLAAGTVPATSGGITQSTTPSGYINPAYEPILPLPVANVKLRDDAKAGGCIFTGPTRILLMGDGTMQVTSPDTKSLTDSPFCNIISGGSLKAGNGTSQPTVVVGTAPTAAGFNGVIYVQSIPTSTSDPNYWASGTAPSCAVKNSTTGNLKPYVIPSLESSKFAPKTGDYGGFPSAQDNSPTTPTAWFDCTKGDVFLQGSLKGQLTIAAENNIGLTGSTYYADSYVYDSGGNPVAVSNANYGSVPTSSTNNLAVVPNNYLYNYNPINTLSSNTDTYKRVSDWKPYLKAVGTTFDPTSQANVVYNFSAMAINHCFGTQNPSPSTGLQGGGIYLYGSIAQKYRCIVGWGNQGYLKHYSYDQRLHSISPPYLLDISEGHWQRSMITELTPN